MDSCIFCNILRGGATTPFVYEDDLVAAFDDISPVAPVHVLIVPKQHIATLNDLDDAPDGLEAAVMRAARTVAADRGIAESGYRLVSNCNRDGGQVVYHVHFHLLGGRPLRQMG
jgi:histidine triad (HIT) family protein